MKTRVKMLKVKIKSLADEARTIRLEERRAGGKMTAVNKRLMGQDNDLRNELRQHRVGIVRSEQRLSMLAYGFLRGRIRAAVERNPKEQPDRVRVEKLVEKFGTTAYLHKDKEAQRAAFLAWWDAPVEKTEGVERQAAA